MSLPEQHLRRIAPAACLALLAVALAVPAHGTPADLDRASGLVIGLRGFAAGSALVTGPQIFDQGALLFGGEAELLLRQPWFEIGAGGGFAALNSNSTVNGRLTTLFVSVAKLGPAAKGAYYLRLDGGLHYLRDIAWQPSAIGQQLGFSRHEVGSAWLPFAGLHAGLLFGSPDTVDFGLGLFVRADLGRAHRNDSDTLGGYLVGFELRIDGMPIHF